MIHSRQLLAAAALACLILGGCEKKVAAGNTATDLSARARDGA